MAVDLARLTAFEALRAVDERDAYTNLVLPAMLTERGLTGRDAALVTELVHGTLRRRGTYDAILDQVAKQGVAKIDPPVLDALRLGAHQLLSMRVPSHAAVSTTVDLVRRQVGHKPTAFVNAVLRKVARRGLGDWLDLVGAGLSETERLAVVESHPAWMVEALGRALEVGGRDRSELPALLGADNASPRVTLVARPGLVDPDALPGEAGRLSPYARVLDGGVPGDLPEIRDGRAGVQDEGSQMVALTAVDASVEGRDERWLDLCAGPGGKAALLGALAAQRGAHLVANEAQPHRAELVRKTVRQLPDVEVTVHDGREGPWEPGSFDRVLVDAPCTGLGALRRRPESRWRRRAEDVPELVTLQVELLGRALSLVRPGGVVVYATCSPHAEETVGVVEAATASGVAELEDVRRWWPHVDGTDAMFAAVLRRTAD
ncbi:transcription antitermination factor NusB [Aeromicrobium sp. IC_218]|uniref:RsmB/NOP family class I SAM-dependent RNA methyltransferase n=1 Tax=Aeromicrobium sp. IC_218 TaxID=2545468 RepID=UPI00103BD025|nr:transcription antitermination factor NusB [Aeromicrobium sp. IC_218]TCI99891.1 rRNA cytosine-C5-methyltransferase [Aeromicrobium sp. IC_218]